MGIQTIALQVLDQSIQILSAPPLVAGTTGVYTVEFSFNDLWEGWEKTAVFSNGITAGECALTENACTVPGALLLPGRALRIGVYGVQGECFLPTLWAAPMEIGAGAYPVEAEPLPPMVAERIMEAVGDLSALKTGDKSSLVAAVNEIYGILTDDPLVSVTAAEINASGHLILTLSSGETLDAGSCVGKDGADGQSAYATAVQGGYSGSEAGFAAALSALGSANAGAHNAIYRGEYLGDTLTDAQAAEIAAGTFEGMYIGDYWTMDGINYRIAAFDYYYNGGDTACKTHHVTLIPDTVMYDYAMNDTDDTSGAYVGSKMYTEGLDAAKATIQKAFGAAHLLTHRAVLQNAATEGLASGDVWVDSTVELMNEQNTYGSKNQSAVGNGSIIPNNYTLDRSQFPLFSIRPDAMVLPRGTYWLRDVVATFGFAVIGVEGNIAHGVATSEYGVRPVFNICG